MQPTIVGLLQHSRACVVLYCKLRLYSIFLLRKESRQQTKRKGQRAVPRREVCNLLIFATDGLALGLQ